MIDDEQVAKSEAILNSIEKGVPTYTCSEMADLFNKAINLLEATNQKQGILPLAWEQHVCSLRITEAILQEKDQYPRISGYLILENGKTLPDPDALTEDAKNYLAKRAMQVANPILKARYNDFLWEKGSPSNKYAHALAAIEAYLESVPILIADSQLGHKYEGVFALPHAIHLAASINDRDKLAQTIFVILSLLEAQYPADTSSKANVDLPWRCLSDLAKMIIYIRQQGKYSNLVDDTILERVQKFAEDVADQHSVSGNGLYDVEQVFLKLGAQIALLRSDNEAAYEQRWRYGLSLEKEAETRVNATNYLAAAAFYESALEHYARLLSDERTPIERRSDLQSRQETIKQTIREMYRRGQTEIKQISAPVEIEQEVIEQMLSGLLHFDTLSECLDNIASEGSLLPDVGAARQLAVEMKDSLTVIMPKSIIVDDMVVSRSQGDEQSEIVDQILMMGIEINSHIILNKLFNRLREQKGLDTASLLNYFDLSGLIDEDNRQIIEVGLSRYFEKDYVSALHILVLQFEDVLRTLFEKAGLSVIQPRKGESGWQFESFGSLLDKIKKEFPQTLPEALDKYIRLVMSEPTGWNLRNRIAHGLIHPQQCIQPVVATVIHLFLILTLFHLKEN